MHVTLIFHLESAESGENVWWVDSPDLPGFYATREHLHEARLVSEASAREILHDRGVDDDGITFSHVLAAESLSSADATPDSRRMIR